MAEKDGLLFGWLNTGVRLGWEGMMVGAAVS